MYMIKGKVMSLRRAEVLQLPLAVYMAVPVKHLSGPSTPCSSTTTACHDCGWLSGFVGFRAGRNDIIRFIFLRWVCSLLITIRASLLYLSLSLPSSQGLEPLPLPPPAQPVLPHAHRRRILLTQSANLAHRRLPHNSRQPLLTAPLLPSAR